MKQHILLFLIVVIVNVYGYGHHGYGGFYPGMTYNAKPYFPTQQNPIPLPSPDHPNPENPNPLDFPYHHGFHNHHGHNCRDHHHGFYPHHHNMGFPGMYPGQFPGTYPIDPSSPNNENDQRAKNLPKPQVPCTDPSICNTEHVDRPQPEVEREVIVENTPNKGTVEGITDASVVEENAEASIDIRTGGSGKTR